MLLLKSTVLRAMIEVKVRIHSKNDEKKIVYHVYSDY